MPNKVFEMMFNRIGKFRQALPWLMVFFLCNILYCFWSYFLTDPNLVLSSNPVYWQWQTWMWGVLSEHRELVAKLYLGIVAGLSVAYLLTVHKLPKFQLELDSNQVKKLIIVWLIVISPLLLSYNALSHDVFNYMFNARMVLVYGANPHHQVALDFKQDLWTRFMHNTHTPAPYFYGWTGLSLLPYSLGAGLFLPTWILFRLFSVLSLILLFLAIKKFAQYARWRLDLGALALLFLNPLILIEIIANAHNDIWMLAPAVWSLALLIEKRPAKLKILASFMLLLLSISIKYATAVLLPIWLLLLLFTVLANWSDKALQILPSASLSNMLNQLKKSITDKLTIWIPLISSVALFLLLLSERSRQFLPWYLSWSLVWLPLIKVGTITPRFIKLWVRILIALSFSSLLRYLPWLWSGEFTQLVNNQEKLITWLGGVVLVTLYFFFDKSKSTREKSARIVR